MKLSVGLEDHDEPLRRRIKLSLLISNRELGFMSRMSIHGYNSLIEIWSILMFLAK